MNKIYGKILFCSKFPDACTCHARIAFLKESAFLGPSFCCVFVPFLWMIMIILFCEGECQAWFHARCVNVNNEQYACLSDSEEKWECPLCQKSDLPPFNSVDAVDCFHFDFQQNLPSPNLTVGHQFYCRLLWTYLFGIYSASTQLSAAYTWHEMLSMRGANDFYPLGRTGAKWSTW